MKLLFQISIFKNLVSNPKNFNNCLEKVHHSAIYRSAFLFAKAQNLITLYVLKA